jgi:hypothetical protein
MRQAPAGAPPPGPDLAAVPERPGRRDPRGRLRHADTVLLSRLHVLVFTGHGTRRMYPGGVTAYPTSD